MRALLIGGGGREHAIGLSIVKSGTELAVLSHNRNPGLLRVARRSIIGDEGDKSLVIETALKTRPDIIFVGPEAPLSQGISDALSERGFRVFAPSLEAARLETSKSYCREFMRDYDISGNVESASFSDLRGAEAFVNEIDYDFVVKPDGLTGGKGVVVQGVHFHSKEEGIGIMEKYFSSGIERILVERRMVGEEFSLQGFTFGSRIAFLPIVQDYKRAFDDDMGPNTGGMGSICFSERGLPFIRKETIDNAKKILGELVKKFARERTDYMGPIYGGFISTSNGPKLLEINARLGDPEAINVLDLMESSIMDVALEMYSEQDYRLEFRDKVNVLRYIVPKGYGYNPIPSRMRMDEERLMLRGIKPFYASVNQRGKELVQTTSRSVALLAEGRDLSEATNKFGDITTLIQGEYTMRKDIGTPEVVKRKTTFMDALLTERA